MTTAHRAPAGADDPTPTEGDAGSPSPWWHPLGVLDRSAAGWRSVERRLARQPLARLTTAGPRTARWATETLRRQVDQPLPGVPLTRLTPSMLGHVAMDESIMAVAVGPNRMPRRSDLRRVGDELAEARELMERRGWLEDPVSFHRTPPPVRHPATSTGWALGRGYERLWWDSGYEPPDGLPGRDRWLGFGANRTASAWVLRHRDRPRPWVVCVHGFGTGSVFMDLAGFRAGHLHDALGLNVVGVVLPAHGSRKPSRLSGEAFLDYDVMNFVHGLAQSVWDVRRVLGWVRHQDPTGVGLFGVSLGGLVTALVAAVEADLDLALAGIPVTDLMDLMQHHSPHHVHLRSVEHGVFDGTAQDVARVVSPLALPVAVPHRARAIFAGLGDRLVPVDQPQRLWAHWDEPETCWFPGNHVGYLWSDKVWRFVDRCAGERGLAPRDRPGP